MANGNLKNQMESNIPKPVLIVGGSLLALSFSMNMIGIYVGPAINDWMEFKIEKARSELSCAMKGNKRIDDYLIRLDNLQKRFKRVEKLAHKKTE